MFRDSLRNQLALTGTPAVARSRASKARAGSGRRMQIVGFALKPTA